MRNLFKIILCSSLILLFSCEKDNLAPSAKVDRIIDDAQPALEFRSPNSFAVDQVYGFLVVEEKDYINRDCSVRPISELFFYARFVDSTSHVGTWTVNGQALTRVNDLNGYRHLFLTHGGSSLATTIAAESEVKIKFESQKTNEYASFEDSFDLPQRMCVSTPSILGDHIFHLDQDLIVNWIPDNDVDVTYVALCSPGIPCITKQFNDDLGSGTISASEFANFPSGTDVFLYAGRALVSIVENTSGKNIAIIRAQWANHASLVTE